MTDKTYNCPWRDKDCAQCREEDSFNQFNAPTDLGFWKALGCAVIIGCVLSSMIILAMVIPGMTTR